MSKIACLKLWGMRAGGLVMGVMLGGCGPGDEGAETPAAAVTGGSGLGAAEGFGIAGMLAADTTLFVGTVGMRGHWEALEKSAYGQRWMAFAEDQIPVSKERDEVEAALEGISDGFVAVGAGGIEWAKWARKASDLYDQVTYRTLFAGGLASVMGGASEPADFMVSALADEALVDLAMVRIEEAQLPPLMVGVKAAKPAELVTMLLDEARLPALLKGAERSELKTAGEGVFTVFEVRFADMIDGKMRRQLLKKVKDAKGKRSVERALELLERKTGRVALGEVGGHVVLAMGEDLAHLESLTVDPEVSLMAKPEWRVTVPQVQKAVVGLVYAEAGLLAALSSEEPFAGMLDGLMAGLKESEMFAVMGEKLEPLVDELRVREKTVFSYDWSTLAAMLWWEEGLHGVASGGGVPKGVEMDKPLALAGLLEEPGLLYGAVGHGSAAGAGRAYFESWMRLLYAVAGELAGVGLYGERGPAMLTMVNEQVVPPLLGAYEASKVLYGEALDSEAALIVNLGGKLPPLPTLPVEGDLPMVRMAGVHVLKDRALLGKSWMTMEGELRKMLAAIPSPVPLVLPEAMSSDKGGVTTYFYALPFLANDLMPCASVNDEVFMLGSSKDLNECLAARVAGAVPNAGVMGMRARVGFGELRRVVEVLVASTKKEEEKAKLREILEALRPFGDLDVKVTREGGELISAFDWEIRDLKRVD